MTTAARPTFEPARGGRGKGEGDLSQLSKQYSSRDLPSHTKIKYRQTTQDAPEEVRNRDFRRELEERERAAAREKNRDRPNREHTTSSSVSKKPRLDQIPAANLDADDPLTDEEDEDEDFEEESDDDDTAALLAELEKIKKERAEEQARKEQEQKAEEERIRMENILSGNPLLNLTGPSQPQANFKVKRRSRLPWLCSAVHISLCCTSEDFTVFQRWPPSFYASFPHAFPLACIHAHTHHMGLRFI
uniref:Spliceosome-associated protein CWC15 homolog n=1 Tax=Equus caballus TaxID=9796 RepID=F7BCN7_HORSE